MISPGLPGSGDAPLDRRSNSGPVVDSKGSSRGMIVILLDFHLPSCSRYVIKSANPEVSRVRRILDDTRRVESISSPVGKSSLSRRFETKSARPSSSRAGHEADRLETGQGCGNVVAGPPQRRRWSLSMKTTSTRALRWLNGMG